MKLIRNIDPVMATLMDDPVILPTSRNSVDRSTIRSILLSDPHDPFNRSPLKIEDVIPGMSPLSSFQILHYPIRCSFIRIKRYTNTIHADVELKAKIEAFKQERKNAKINAATAAALATVTTGNSAAMDTSPG